MLQPGRKTEHIFCMKELICENLHALRFNLNNIIKTAISQRKKTNAQRWSGEEWVVGVKAKEFRWIDYKCSKHDQGTWYKTVTLHNEKEEPLAWLVAWLHGCMGRLSSAPVCGDFSTVASLCLTSSQAKDGRSSLHFLGLWRLKE